MATQKVEIEIDEKLIPPGCEPVVLRPIRGKTAIMGNNYTAYFPAELMVKKLWQPPEWLRLTKNRCVYRDGNRWYAATTRESSSFLLLGGEHSAGFRASSMLDCFEFDFDPPCGMDVPDEQTVFSW